MMEVLIPSVCISCEKKLLQGEVCVCSSCVASIVRTEHAIVLDNGIDMLLKNLIHNSNRKTRYVKGAAWSYYNRQRGQVLCQLIEKGKYGGRPWAEVFSYLGYLAASEYIDSDFF
jgi:predicted amidophosphoribosyltransferase